MGWTGDESDSRESMGLSVDHDTLLQAIFGTPLTTTITGDGAVVLSSSVAAYPYGQIVRLTAVPSAGHRFAGWGGGATGSANPLAFEVKSPNPTVSAEFIPLNSTEHALTVVVEGRGHVEISPSKQSYPRGEVVMLLARPEDRQDFIEWSGDGVGKTPAMTLTMTKDLVVRCQFTSKPLLSVASLPEDYASRVYVTLQGDFGVTYRIERSEGWGIWTSWSQTANGLGVTLFGDTPNRNRKFYRAVTIATP